MSHQCNETGRQHSIIPGKGRWLLLLPFVLIVSCLLVFKITVANMGYKKGYYAGFVFYWLFWCFLSPVLLIGWKNVNRLYHTSFPNIAGKKWIALLILTPRGGRRAVSCAWSALTRKREAKFTLHMMF